MAEPRFPGFGVPVEPWFLGISCFLLSHSSFVFIPILALGFRLIKDIAHSTYINSLLSLTLVVSLLWFNSDCKTWRINYSWVAKWYALLIYDFTFKFEAVTFLALGLTNFLGKTYILGLVDFQVHYHALLLPSISFHSHFLYIGHTHTHTHTDTQMLIYIHTLSLTYTHTRLMCKHIACLRVSQSLVPRPVVSEISGLYIKIGDSRNLFYKK